MAPRNHAILSASSAHRWLNCSPSARLEQDFEDRETEAAAEGTAAHALAEHKLRKAMKLQTKKPISTYDNDEMDGHTDGYVQYKDIFRKTLLPITEMEKLMGKQTFAEVLGNCVHKPAGKPTLVPESDKRPAMNTAKTDFNDYQED